MKIKPGFYHGMPNDDYHQGPGVSTSGLKKVIKCPEEYDFVYNRGYQQDQTKAMEIGTAFHTLTLEPEKITTEIAVVPENINRRTKAGKAEYAAFLEESEGKTILTQEEFEGVVGMASSVRYDPKLELMLKKGNAEVSIFHQDEQLGELIKVRPDWIPTWDYHGVIFDLKSADDASYPAFQRAIVNFKYHMQAALYLDIANAEHARLYGESDYFKEFMFVVCEKKPPYKKAVYIPDEEMIALGRDEYTQALMLYAKCKRQERWPGYNGDLITKISMPVYAAKSIRAQNLLETYA